MKKSLKLALAALLPLTALPVFAQQHFVPRLWPNYSAVFKLTGEADGTVTQKFLQGEGSESELYFFSSITKAHKFIFTDTISQSVSGTVSLVQNGNKKVFKLTPDTYKQHMSLGMNGSAEMRFRYRHHVVDAFHNHQTQSVGFHTSIYDSISYPLQLRMMLNQHPKLSEYVIHVVKLTRNYSPELIELDFKPTRNVPLKTKMGTLKTTELTATYVFNGKTIENRMWFAKKWRNFMVQSSAYMNGELEAKATLSKYTQLKNNVFSR